MSEQSLSIGRPKLGASTEDSCSNLLHDMNDCYTRLRELVPDIPPGTKVSPVELLQHVIDYIFDLQQIALEGQGEAHESDEVTLLTVKATEISAEDNRGV